ncbi:MAG: potassium transporter Trk [Deltaproteobacteria bacterium]|nr:potassium transporter Trk [Deltaproteobacteria bacterium]
MTRFDYVRSVDGSLPGRAPAQERRLSRLEFWLAFAGPAVLVLLLGAAALGVVEGSILAWVGLGLGAAVLLVSLRREIVERDLRGIWHWVVLAAAPFFWDRPLTMGAIFGLRQLLMSLRTLLRRRRGRQLIDYLWTHPVELLAVGFLAVIVFGTLLLMLPAASTQLRGASVIDALFTATSATCVTGLTVVDTATFFTPFGWAVIAALIQVGGIGVMALSTLAAVVAGKQLGLAQSGAVAASMETTAPVDAVRIVRVVVIGTVVAEVIGGVILFESFRGDMEWSRALGYAAFHAISAFCNAGFALWTDNLVPFQGHAPVVLTVSFLVILGGLGFLVLAELWNWLASRRRRRRRILSLHARLVLGTTAVLLAAGMLVFALLEWQGAMAGMSVPEKLLNAFFNSVTPRTAGFNTVPMGDLSMAWVFVLIVLMFIGGSPGSTAGGIKTSTAATILLAVRAYMRGREAVEVGGRAVSAATVIRAVVLVALATAACSIGFFLLVMTQDVPFHELFFETVSAFGTVGLSLGATAEVDSVGKLVLVGLMYVGRVGPLTLILLLGSSVRDPVRYPEEPVALT